MLSDVDTPKLKSQDLHNKMALNSLIFMLGHQFYNMLTLVTIPKSHFNDIFNFEHFHFLALFSAQAHTDFI